MNSLPNLLIVDDTEINLFVLAALVKRLNVNIIQALSGPEALKKIKGVELALAIIDVRMPVMNGYELARKMHEERAVEKVPIIFLTASHINDLEVFTGYDSGAVDYIFKPIEDNVMLSKIKVFLDLYNQKQTIAREAALLKKTADELVRVNKALKKSEEKYRSYVDNAPDGVFISDETGKFIEVNEAACLLSGYSKRELLRMSVSDLLPTELLAEGMTHFSKVVETGSSRGDLIYRRKNGTRRWWTVESVRLNENRFLGFAKDITHRIELEESLRMHQIELEMQNEELKQAKEKAEAASQKYSRLFELAPSGYFTLSEKKAILDLNQSGSRMLGLGEFRSRLMNNQFDYFVSAKTRPVFDAFFLSLFISRHEQSCEVVLETEDYFPRYVHIEGVIAGNGDQCLLNVVDITGRIQVEKALQDAHWRLGSIIEATHAGTWEWNIQTGETVFNEVWAQLFGYTLDELAPTSHKTWENLVHPDDLILTNEMLERHFSGELDYYDIECRMRHKDGHWVWIQDRGRVITRTMDGKSLLMFGTHTDISERKEAEKELEKTSTRLALATRAGGVGVWDLDIVNDLVIWDDQMFRLYGVEKKEFSLSFDSWLGCIHPEDVEMIKSEMQLSLQGEKEFDTEFRVCWPDTTIHNIRAMSYVLYDAAGKPVRNIGTNWDITGQKRLEEKLISSEVNFRTFFETMNDMVIVGSMQGEIIYVNKAIREKLGYSDAELHRMQVLDLNPAEMRAEAEQILGRMFAGKQAFCPLPLLRKNGSFLPAETNIWFGKWNGQDCIFGVAKDISAEQEALQKFNKIFQNNPALIAITTIPEGIFSDVNETFLNKIGYSREEIIGKTAEELGLFIQSKKQKEAAEDLAKIGLMHNLELEVVTKSGKILDGLFSGEIIESQGQKFFLTVMVDITQRKQAEDILRKSESNLAEAQRIAHIGSWEWDMIANTVKWSKEMFNVYDIDPETFDGDPQSLLKVIHPDDIESYLNSLNMNLSAGDSPILEYRVIHKDGSVHNLFAQGRIEMDHTGRPVWGVGTVQDITARKQAEEEIRRANNFLDSIVENIPDMIFIKDTKTLQFVRFNKAGEELLGIPREEMIGKTDYDFFSKEEADFFSEKDRNVLNTGEMTDIPEEPVLTVYKGTRLLHTRKVPILNNQGKSEYLLGISEDITEMKRAEQTLKLSEEKYRTMLSASPDGVFLIDIRGFFTEVSEIGLELLGADKRDDLVGRHIFRFIPADQKKTLREIIDRTKNEGLSQNVELKIRKKNHATVFSEVSSTLIQDSQGIPLSYMVILRDISQRRKTMAKQIHADRMANLGEMASGIAHEINQPLNIISMVMDKILFETYKTEIVDIGFLNTKANKIFENIIRIRNIIDHVRAFSRNHDDFLFTAFDVNASIESAVSMLAEQFKHLGISLTLYLDRQIPQIQGNTFKFEQVIINFLVNAKDAVLEKKNKAAGFEDMIVGINTYRKEQLLVVEVTDNGIGINDEDIDHVLLPFYTTKDEGKGTGLGLSICYQIVKEMGGNIDIFSNSGQGTTIRLTKEIPKMEE